MLRGKMKSIDINDIEWFDMWSEDRAQLMDDEDYPRLVQCCLQRYDRCPDDPYALESLADAYVLNGQQQKAIDLVAPYYHREPGHPLYEHLILEALFGMGKGIDDFSWRRPPKVLRMGDGVLDECYSYLKLKRKPRTVSNLYIMFIGRAYLLFNEFDLFQGLVSDRRFRVENQDLCVFAEVSVVRAADRTG